MLVSAQALILALFGGVGSLWGPVIGAMVLVPLAEGLNAELGNVLPGIQGVVYGVAIIVDHSLRAGGGLLAGARPVCTKQTAAACAAAGGRRRRLPPSCRSPRTAAGGDLLVLRGVGISFGGLRALDERRPDRPGRRALRHHRSQRRRQDDAVQRHQRVSRPRQRHDRIRRRAADRAAAEPGVPARHRPHLSGGARLSAHDRARKRHRRRLCRRRRRRRSRERMALAALDRVGLSGRAERDRRRADDAGVAADGAGARAGAAARG